MKIDYKNKKLVSQETVDNQQVELNVQAAALQLNSDLLATKRAMLEAEKELQEAKQAYPFNTQRIIDAQVKVEDFRDAIERIETLQKELFS